MFNGPFHWLIIALTVSFAWQKRQLFSLRVSLLSSKSFCCWHTSYFKRGWCQLSRTVLCFALLFLYKARKLSKNSNTSQMFDTKSKKYSSDLQYFGLQVSWREKSLPTPSCGGCCRRCNHKDTWAAESRRAQRWRTWSFHGSWSCSPRSSPQPQSELMGRGRRRSRGFCWHRGLSRPQGIHTYYRQMGSF